MVDNNFRTPTESQANILNNILQKSFGGENIRNMNKNLGQFSTLTGDLNRQLNTATTDGIKIFMRGMEDFVVKGKSFKDIFQKMGFDLLNQLSKQFINTNKFLPANQSNNFLDQIGGAISGVLGVRAKGGAVQSGQPYLVGEKGPELFVPGRTSGFVMPNQISGQTNIPPIQVNIVNNANANVTVSQRQNQNGTRNLQVQIDEMVANSLTKGAKTRGALRNIFGVDPVLTQR